MGQLNKRNKNTKFNKNTTKLCFDGELSDIKPIGNTGFSKVFIKIMYDDGNRNSSYFDKNMVINKMIPTLYNVPITGNYLKEKDNFGGHDSKIEITSDGDMNYIDLTQPYGVVPESSVVEWQNIISSDEKILRDYLTCDGILWTGRYQEQLDKLLENGMNLSMEVEIIDGKEEQDGIYHVYDAQFSALTILGKSDNPSDNVEPCFHDSSINAYSLDKFKQNFSLMLKEIKNSLDSELESKTSDFDLNNKTIQDKEKEDKNMKLTKTEIANKFTLTYEQLEDEIRRVLSTVVYICNDGWCGDYECRKYYLLDFDETFAFICDCEQNIYVKIAYTKVGDDISLDFEKASRIRTQFVDWVGATPEDDDISISTEMEMSLKETFKAKAEEIVSTKIAEAVSTKETELNAEFAIKLTDKEVELNAKFEATSKAEPIVENADLKDLNEKFSALEKTILAKDTELLELKEFKATTLHTEIQTKADALFAKYVEYINEDEKKDLNSKLFELKFEDFEDKVKAIALPKVEAKLYALNQKSNLEDPNKINISLMGLPVDDNIKNNKTSKTSIELLEEYVQN